MRARAGAEGHCAAGAATPRRPPTPGGRRPASALPSLCPSGLAPHRPRPGAGCRRGAACRPRGPARPVPSPARAPGPARGWGWGGGRGPRRARCRETGIVLGGGEESCAFLPAGTGSGGLGGRKVWEPRVCGSGCRGAVGAERWKVIGRRRGGGAGAARACVWRARWPPGRPLPFRCPRGGPGAEAPACGREAGLRWPRQEPRGSALPLGRPCSWERLRGDAPRSPRPGPLGARRPGGWRRTRGALGPPRVPVGRPPGAAAGGPSGDCAPASGGGGRSLPPLRRPLCVRD